MTTYARALVVWAVGSVAWSALFHVPFVIAFSYFSILFYTFFAISLIAFLIDKSARKSLKKGFETFISEIGAENEKK